MKEIKILNSIEEDCNFDENLGYYRIFNDGLDDIIILKNYKYKEIRQTKKRIKNGVEKVYEIVGVENCDKHTVKPLETLKTIANKYNVSDKEIIIKNNLKNDKLYVGQVLDI